MINCTLKFGRSAVSTQKILKNIYHFVNISEPQFMTFFEEKDDEEVHVVFYAQGNINTIIALCSEKWIDNIYSATAISGYGHIMD